MSKSILPSSLQTDPNYLALNRILEQWQDIDLTQLLIYWIDDVDASVLPHLAKQFHVLGLEGWDYATTEAEQRALIKQAVELHRYKGTPWAVRQGIRRIHPDVDIEEWQDYGGEPYHFRFKYNEQEVHLTLFQALKLYYAIESLKSLRSKLDGGLEAVENVEHEIKLATHIITLSFYGCNAQDPDNTGALAFVCPTARVEVTSSRLGCFNPYINPVKVNIVALCRFEVSQ